MFTDVFGDVIGHGSLFIFAGDRREIHHIAVRMRRIVAQARPVARHFVKASPPDKIVVRISAACFISVKLRLAVIVHPGNAVLAIVPSLSPAAKCKFPHKIGIVH